jgi:5-enolpyruvylshikimate-3-phosphate synthase
VYITHKSDKQKKQAIKVEGDIEDTGFPLAAQPVTMRRGCNIKLPDE